MGKPGTFCHVLTGKPWKLISSACELVTKDISMHVSRAGTDSGAASMRSRSHSAVSFRSPRDSAFLGVGVFFVCVFFFYRVCVCV